MCIMVEGIYGECTNENCVLPNCRCASQSRPPELEGQEIPQIVTFTFDDAVNDNYVLFQQLLSRNRLQNNDCPIRATFFVSGETTIYNNVNNLYMAGHEIASHSIHHQQYPRVDQWAEEICGQRDNIIEKAGVRRSDIFGMRAPYLALGADEQFNMIDDYGFEYDSSFCTEEENDEDGQLAIWWPYTLDYPPNWKYCNQDNCPTISHPGVWEIPLNTWVGLDGSKCSQPDFCTETNTKEETLEYLWHNFNIHFNNARTPLGIYVHSHWFEYEFRIAAMEEFIDQLLDREYVYFTSMHQLIEWMRDPTPLSEINEFEPWKTGCQ